MARGSRTNDDECSRKGRDGLQRKLIRSPGSHDCTISTAIKQIVIVPCRHNSRLPAYKRLHLATYVHDESRTEKHYCELCHIRMYSLSRILQQAHRTPITFFNESPRSGETIVAADYIIPSRPNVLACLSKQPKQTPLLINKSQHIVTRNEPSSPVRRLRGTPPLRQRDSE